MLIIWREVQYLKGSSILPGTIEDPMGKVFQRTKIVHHQSFSDKSNIAGREPELMSNIPLNKKIRIHNTECGEDEACGSRQFEPQNIEVPKKFDYSVHAEQQTDLPKDKLNILENQNYLLKEMMQQQAEASDQQRMLLEQILAEGKETIHTVCNNERNKRVCSARRAAK